MNIFHLLIQLQVICSDLWTNMEISLLFVRSSIFQPGKAQTLSFSQQIVKCF